MKSQLLTLVVTFCLLAVTLSASARQSGPLIAELLDYENVRAAIPASTASTFARVVRATPDQQTAAASLADAARTELARVVNRHLRTVRDDPTLEQIITSEAKVVEDAANVERQLLADLRDILLAKQVERFDAFERAHRRSLWRLARPQPMPIDIWTFLAENSIEPGSSEGLSTLLDTFDGQSDAALVRQRRALKAYFDNIRKGYDGSDEGRARDLKLQRELRASDLNLNRVAASVVEPLLTLLPAAVADKLVIELTAAATLEYDKNLVRPERYPVVREALALDLTAEQRRSAQALIDAAKTEATALARTCVIEGARYSLLSDERRTDGRTSPLNLYLEQASKLRVRLSADILGLLTPAQRLVYDASDVIDPSSTSTVKD